MRTVSEIRDRLARTEAMIAYHRANNRRVGGGQYTIAAVLRWVLETEYSETEDLSKSDANSEGQPRSPGQELGVIV